MVKSINYSSIFCKQNKKIIKNNKKPILSVTPEANLSNLLPLGNSQLSSDDYPSINLDILYAKIKSVELTTNDNNYGERERERERDRNGGVEEWQAGQAGNPSVRECQEA